MRPIDADAVERNAYDYLHYKAELENWEFDIIVNFLDKAPTINPEDLRPHGRWEKIGMDKRGRGGIFKCTACGRNMPHISDFCPNCGAKMDLKEEVSNHAEPMAGHGAVDP